jgi:hypothetical protein
MAGWGDFAGKLSQQFQGRMERNLNEFCKIIKEKAVLERQDQNDANTNRIDAINQRFDELVDIFKNSAKD